MLVRSYLLYKYGRSFNLRAVSETGTRAESSRRIRDAIVAAAVRILAREGVAAVPPRRVPAEADVAWSSTTCHFAPKAGILEAALQWCARGEVGRIAAIADRLDD